MPGQLLEPRFDPHTGKLAYPFLRLIATAAVRVNHGPAASDPTPAGADPPPPGANGRGARAPRAPSRSSSTSTPSGRGLVEGDGELFVLRQQEDAVRADPSLQVPLALRANAGRGLRPHPAARALGHAEQPLSKVSLHIHFVQFDTQASDGLTAGFNYEETMLRSRNEGASVTAPTATGANEVSVDDASRFLIGALGVGVDQDVGFEAARRVSDPAATRWCSTRARPRRGSAISAPKRPRADEWMAST